MGHGLIFLSRLEKKKWEINGGKTLPSLALPRQPTSQSKVAAR
jgi:hypothetical protein